jgi:hypothetical protein
MQMMVLLLALLLQARHDTQQDRNGEKSEAMERRASVLSINTHPGSRDVCCASQALAPQ